MLKQLSSIELSNNPELSTVFDCLVNKKCNSLGLARTFSILLKKYQIDSIVVGGLLLKKEHYLNAVEYDIAEQKV